MIAGGSLEILKNRIAEGIFLNEDLTAPSTIGDNIQRPELGHVSTHIG